MCGRGVELTAALQVTPALAGRSASAPGSAPTACTATCTQQVRTPLQRAAVFKTLGPACFGRCQNGSARAAWFNAGFAGGRPPGERTARLRMRGTSAKLGYDGMVHHRRARTARPLMPCDAAARETNRDVCTPSILSWSIADNNWAHCSSKSALRTMRVVWRVPNCGQSLGEQGDSSFRVPTYSAKSKRDGGAGSFGRAPPRAR